MLNQSKPWLERELTEIASANLQKMIPVRVELEELSLNAILNFRPLNASTSSPKGKAEEPLTLGQLFERITFDKKNYVSKPPRLPKEIENLLQLLKYSANGEVKDNGLARLGAYPGLHAFEVSPRRLVDLWNQLHQRIAGDSKPLDEDLLGVFEQHWKRITDEDPNLDSESRNRLRDDGNSSCEVIADPDRVFGSIRSMFGGEIHLPPTSQDPPVFPLTVRPTLRFIDDGPGTGIPLLAVRGRYISEDNQQKQVFVQNHRTRAAFVLLHDLTALFRQDDANQLKMPAMAEMKWEGEGTASVPWPMPALPTFVKFTQLAGKLKNIFRENSKTERLHFETEEFVAIEIC